MSNRSLVAVGDSLVNGHGNSMAGVPALGWPQWLADAMDLSYTRYGLGGANSTRIVNELLPRVRGRYAVGVLTMGTNDAYQSWDSDRFEKNLRHASDTLAAACERVAVLSTPYSAETTKIVQAVASEYGLLVIDGNLRGPRLMSPDGIHPTALGHLEIADRAASALNAPSPKLLAKNYGKGSLGAAYWATYAVGSCRQAVRKVMKPPSSTLLGFRR